MEIKDDILIYKNLESKNLNFSLENSGTSTVNISFISINTQSTNLQIRNSKEIFLSYLNKLHHFKLPNKSNLNTNISNKRKRK